MGKAFEHYDDPVKALEVWRVYVHSDVELTHEGEVVRRGPFGIPLKLDEAFVVKDRCSSFSDLDVALSSVFDGNRTAHFAGTTTSGPRDQDIGSYRTVATRALEDGSRD